MRSRVDKVFRSEEVFGFGVEGFNGCRCWDGAGGGEGREFVGMPVRSGGEELTIF